MNLGEAAKVAQYGGVGVAIVCLAVLVYAIRRMCDTADKTMEIVERNAVANTSLSDSVRALAEAIEKSGEVVGELRQIVLTYMGRQQ